MNLLCFTWALLLVFTHAFYSPYYRKCRLGIKGTDLGALRVSRVARYEPGFTTPEQGLNQLQTNYTDFNFLYLESVGHGGSGQVFLVEQLETKQLKIVKRFFREKPLSFRMQNFIMNKMKYPIGWHHENNEVGSPTLATYQSKQSVVLRDLELQSDNQCALIFYKICKELEKAHRSGIIHHDIKMGNILISSHSQSVKLVEVELIDWNLSVFYYPGYESSLMHGTKCYHPPEVILKQYYITPAADIWSLGVVFFTYLTDKKPFMLNCSSDEFKAVVSFCGAEKLLKMYEKYRIESNIESSLIRKMKANMTAYKEISLRDRIPTKNRELFTPQLIDLFEKMLEVDPEKRITITEVLNHPYFDQIQRLPPIKTKPPKPQDELKAPANNLVPAEPPKQSGQVEDSNS